MNDKRVNQYLILPEQGQRKDTKLAVEYSEEQITELLKQGYVIVNQDDFNMLIGNSDGEHLIADDGSVYLSQHLQMQSCWQLQSLLKLQSLKPREMQKRLNLLSMLATSTITTAKPATALARRLLRLMYRPPKQSLQHLLTGQPLIIKMLRLLLMIYVA